MGKSWDINASPAQNHIPKSIQSMNRSSSEQSDFSSYQNTHTNLSALQNDPHIKDQKEAFFAKRQNENLQRRDDIPPNQGGKYGGFGYSMEPPPKSASQEFVGTAMTSLASGWSLFSSSATKIASKATESAYKIGEIASNKVADISGSVKEGKLLDDVGSQVNQLASKVSDLGRRGWREVAGSGFNGHEEIPGNYDSASFDKVASPTTGYQPRDATDESSSKLLPGYQEAGSAISDNLIDYSPGEEKQWGSWNPHSEGNGLTSRGRTTKPKRDGVDDSMINIEPRKIRNKQEDDAWDLLNQ